ncbi:MAG: RuBisCO large subunit C-terminal-like domain-containing protein [Eubacteriaceae bacterium]|jgi:2,3-diketo-5-methylthiopentyl-1-phosphate enolase|nr:RuBisCO large subunit C-terminal-like domain-containing protein [Eubacteriaceae bacterium]
MNRFYSPLLNPTYEGINADDYCIATYLVGAEKDEEPVLKAASIGIEQTTGSWIDVPAETDEMREKYCSKILGVYEVPDYENMANVNMNVKEGQKRFYIFRIGYPVANIENNIPLFFATITGNITSMPYLRLLDVDFPAKFAAQFKGPQFGIKGIREVLGVPERPLLNNMIKPCTGYTPDVGAKLFYEAAVGGVDIIKDDELIGGDRSFNKLADRVRANMDAAKRADAEKGETTLYACNITDEVGKLKDNAMTVIKNGGNCIMIDSFCTGLSAMRALAEDPDINVPILSHCCFGPALSVSEYQGVSSLVLTKLARLCGADIHLTEPPYGKFDITFNKYIRNITACESKFYDLNTIFPFVGGGVIPGLVPQLVHDIGNDVLLGVGAGIHGHPMGPRAGAVAFRQAIDAVMNNVPLRKAMKGKEELTAAIDKWGIYGEEKIKDLYAI